MHTSQESHDSPFLANLPGFQWMKHNDNPLSGRKKGDVIDGRSTTLWPKNSATGPADGAVSAMLLTFLVL